MDGSWCIDRLTNSNVLFSALIADKTVWSLYERHYDTRTDAEAGMKRINEILAA
jgi:hypothetical protein